MELYGVNPTPLPYKPAEQFLVISEYDLNLASYKLSHNKATGMDGLKDVMIKALVKHQAFKTKLRLQMQNWLNGESVPAYLTTARTIFLSKEDTPYPSEGNVRIIAILPALTKLYELVLLEKLNKETARLHLVHENQRGFVAGKSTLHNIHDVVRLIKNF